MAMCHTFHVYLNFIVIENALIVRVPIGLWCGCKCVCRLEINWFPSNLLLFCQIQSNFSFIFGFVFPNSVPIRTPTYAYYLDGILLVVARMRTEYQYFILCIHSDLIIKFRKCSIVKKNNWYPEFYCKWRWWTEPIPLFANEWHAHNEALSPIYVNAVYFMFMDFLEQHTYEARACCHSEENQIVQRHTRTYAHI